MRVHEGLGLIGGKVVDMTPVIGPGLKVPHIGWNALRLTAPDHPLWKYIRPGSFVYFVHSYFASDCAPDVIAVTEYGAELTAAVGKENILGCQFHPEKSGEVGLNTLRARQGRSAVPGRLRPNDRLQRRSALRGSGF